jgi:hypothetical protein
MTDAPEKIWAGGREPEWFFDDPSDHRDGGYKEYTRTDIAQARYNKLEREAVNLTETQMQWEARIDKLESALRDCEVEIDEYVKQEYPHDHPVQERYRQRGFSSNPARIALAEIKKPT